MNFWYFIPILLLLWIVLMQRRKKRMIMRKILKHKKKEEKENMFELAKRFLEKECIVYTFDSQLTGVIKEVAEGAILLENGGMQEAVNADFIVRIREYPKKKNGKKKSVVLD